MQTQVRNVDVQVKGLQVSPNELAFKEELAVVEYNSEVCVGVVEQCLNVMCQEMHSMCGLIDQSIHDLHERVDSMKQKPVCCS